MKGCLLPGLILIVIVLAITTGVCMFSGWWTTGDWFYIFHALAHSYHTCNPKGLNC